MAYVTNLRALRAELVEQRRTEAFAISDQEDEEIDVSTLTELHLAIQALEQVISEEQGTPPDPNNMIA